MDLPELPDVLKAAEAEGGWRVAPLSVEALDKGLAKYPTDLRGKVHWPTLREATAHLSIMYPIYFSPLTFTQTSHEQAIQILSTKHTSPGYGWREGGLTTSDLVARVDIQNYLSDMFDKFISTGEHPPFYALNCLKDEIRMTHKDTRQINPFPLEFLYVMVRLFYSSHKTLCKTALSSVSALGMTAEKGGWALLKSVIEYKWKPGDKFFDVDVTGMDSRILRCLIEEIYSLRQSNMSLPDHVFKVLVDTIVGTMIVNYDGTVYKKNSGNPSGQFLTGDDNTLVFALALVYSFLRVYGFPPDDKTLRFLLFGDDGVGRARSWVDLERIFGVMHTELDLITKVHYYKTFDECEFLSKRTGYVEGHPTYTHSNLNKMLYQLKHWTGSAVDYHAKLTNFMGLNFANKPVYNWLKKVRKEFLEVYGTPDVIANCAYHPCNDDFFRALHDGRAISRVNCTMTSPAPRNGVNQAVKNLIEKKENHILKVTDDKEKKLESKLIKQIKASSQAFDPMEYAAREGVASLRRLALSYSDSTSMFLNPRPYPSKRKAMQLKLQLASQPAPKLTYDTTENLTPDNVGGFCSLATLYPDIAYAATRGDSYAPTSSWAFRGAGVAMPTNFTDGAGLNYSTFTGFLKLTSDSIAMVPVQRTYDAMYFPISSVGQSGQQILVSIASRNVSEIAPITVQLGTINSSGAFSLYNTTGGTGYTDGKPIAIGVTNAARTNLTVLFKPTSDGIDLNGGDYVVTIQSVGFNITCNNCPLLLNTVGIDSSLKSNKFGFTGESLVFKESFSKSDVLARGFVAAVRGANNFPANAVTLDKDIFTSIKKSSATQYNGADRDGTHGILLPTDPDQLDTQILGLYGRASPMQLSYWTDLTYDLSQYGTPTINATGTMCISFRSADPSYMAYKTPSFLCCGIYQALTQEDLMGCNPETDSRLKGILENAKGTAKTLAKKYITPENVKKLAKKGIEMAPYIAAAII